MWGQPDPIVPVWSRGHGTAGELRRSEDVGRVVFALIEKGLIRRQGSDSEIDFEGLFDVG